MRFRILRSEGEKVALFLSFFMALSGWYTQKFMTMHYYGIINSIDHPLFAWEDWKGISLCYVAISLLLLMITRWVYPISLKRSGEKGKYFKWAFAFMFLWRVPFLLAFYPAAGMGDTYYMMKDPLHQVVQFPWAYSLLYGYASKWGLALGNREIVLFLLSLLQNLAISYGLTKVCYWVWESFGKKSFLFLYLYFTFLPMVGNYSIAAVRDGLFSLGILLWTCIFLFLPREKWEKRHTILYVTAALLISLLRSNGLPIAMVLTVILCVLYKQWKKQLALFFLCAVISVVPGRLILHYTGEEVLFQESMAMPLQQLGRVYVVGGDMDEETKDLLNSFLAEEKWKEKYIPFTVDFVKWHPDFNHDRMTEKKHEFLEAWWKTGLKNPRLYFEAFCTETFFLWELEPFDTAVQSRFGYAMTDENLKVMVSQDDNHFVLGDFPMPMGLKSFLGNISFYGSRYLSAGLCLWITLYLVLLGGKKRKWKWKWNILLGALPVLCNTGTLFLSTPAASAFRYSFSYVLVLPLLVLFFIHQEKQGEITGAQPEIEK